MYIIERGFIINKRRFKNGNMDMGCFGSRSIGPSLLFFRYKEKIINQKFREIKTFYFN